MGTGHQGLAGAVGPAGADGKVGLSGQQGLTGADGKVGLSGQQGLTGAIGPAGTNANSNHTPMDYDNALPPPEQLKHIKPNGKKISSIFTTANDKIKKSYHKNKNFI